MNDEGKSWLVQVLRDSARDLMKAGMIINGAAAITLMAFVGNIWSDVNDRAELIPFANSILYLCIGVTMSGFAFVAHYSIFENIARETMKSVGILHAIVSFFIVGMWGLMSIAPLGTFMFAVFKFHDAISNHAFP